MKKIIFLTGATGLLGSQILKLILLNEQNSIVYLLIRGKDQKEAEERMLLSAKRVLKSSLNKKLLNRIKVLKGDQASFCLGVDEKKYGLLCSEVNEIYHCAASTSFRMSLDEARSVNLEGTRNVLELSNRCRNLRRVNYVSTTFLIGNQERIFREDDVINQGQNFNNTYEQSKLEAELLVNEFREKGSKISIFRPSVIIGEYLSGETSNFKMFYEPLHFFSLELFKTVPANEDVVHNIIATDVAAKAIYILANNEKNEDVYHIISPQNGNFGHFMKTASDFFGYSNPEFVPLERFDIKGLSFIQKSILEPFIPYFNYKSIFKSEKTEAILEKYNFKYPPIDEKFYIRLFKFCKSCGFIKLKKGFAGGSR